MIYCKVVFIFLMAISGANEPKVDSYMDNRILETPMHKNMCFAVLKSDYVDGRIPLLALLSSQMATHRRLN